METDYDCEIITDDTFSLDESSSFPPPALAQQDDQEEEVNEELPTYMGPEHATMNEPEDDRKVPEAKEMKGTVLKKKGNEWKDRYLHVRPQMRALFYYEKLAKAKKNSKPLGVYPLIGAVVGKVQHEVADDSFTFTVTLRTGQKVTFKLLDREEAREWRSAVRDTVKMPCTAPSEGSLKGDCSLKQMLMNVRRTIVLDYSSAYFFAYKKNDQLSPTEQHPLKSSVVIPQKSFDSSFVVVVETGKDYRKEYSFKNPEDWAKWCIQLEAMVNRERHSK